MKCIYCNSEIAAGSVFCTVCGKKQESTESSGMAGFCTNCGKQLPPGSVFCTSCGTKVGQGIQPAASGGTQNLRNPQMPQNIDEYDEPTMPINDFRQNNQAGFQGNNSSMNQSGYQNSGNHNSYQNSGNHNRNQGGYQNQGRPSGVQSNYSRPSGGGAASQSEDSSGRIALIIIICVLAALLAGLGFVFIYKTIINPTQVSQNIDRDDDRDDEKDKADEVTTEEVSEEKAEAEEQTEAETEEEDDEDEEEEHPEADYDLGKDDFLDMKGSLEKNTDGYIIISWGDKLSFQDGDVYVDGVRSARLDLSKWDEPIYDYAEIGDEINVTGKGYIEDERVFIRVDNIYDAKGKDITLQKKVAKNGDYIIPDSDVRKLSLSDIEDLSLREVNYAKNEIYARHGRKFASKELQNYFNSKSWYEGTIDPDDFKQSYLSSIESANASLLSDREYSLDPNGYKLDQ